MSITHVKSNNQARYEAIRRVCLWRVQMRVIVHCATFSHNISNYWLVELWLIEIRLLLSGSCWETVLELCGSCANYTETVSYNGSHYTRYYTRHYTRGKRGYLYLRYFDFFFRSQSHNSHLPSVSRWPSRQ